MTRQEIASIAAVIREQVNDVEQQIHVPNRPYDVPHSQRDPRELAEFLSLHKERDRLFNLTVCMANAIEEMQQTSSVPFPRNDFLSAAFSGDPDSLTR